MNDRPDRIEELLRAAMRSHTADALPAPGLARRALRGAARGRRLNYAATAAASVAAVGAVAASGVAIQRSAHRPTPALGAGFLSATGSCYDTASAYPSPSASNTGPKGTAAAVASRAPASYDAFPNHPPMSQAPSQAIQAVKLADPAPGYAERRNRDGVVPTGFGASSSFWTATFTLARPVASDSPSGDAYPPGATVLVIDGHPFDLEDPAVIGGIPVSGATTVLGHEAWVTSSCDQTDVVFSTGRFEVLLVAYPGGDSATVAANVASLKALAGALQGLQ